MALTYTMKWIAKIQILEPADLAIIWLHEKHLLRAFGHYVNVAALFQDGKVDGGFSII